MFACVWERGSQREGFQCLIGGGNKEGEKVVSRDDMRLESAQSKSTLQIYSKVSAAAYDDVSDDYVHLSRTRQDKTRQSSPSGILTIQQ